MSTIAYARLTQISGVLIPQTYFLLIPTKNNSKAVFHQLVTSEMYLGTACDDEDLLESQDSPIDSDINASVTSLRTRPYNPLNFSSNILNNTTAKSRKAEVRQYLFVCY